MVIYSGVGQISAQINPWHVVDFGADIFLAQSPLGVRFWPWINLHIIHSCRTANLRPILI